MSSWVSAYAGTADAVTRLFHPHVEVVLHDVAQDRIVGIWNPVSGRQVGDPSLLEPELTGDLQEGEVIGPYPKTGVRGEPISAVSVVVAGGAGLLCLNFDQSVLLATADLLRAFAAPSTEPRSEVLFARDWREELNDLVLGWCRQHGANQSRLTRDERIELVRALDHKGVFRVQRAVPHLATVLGVSRATLYTTLKSARGTSDA